MTKVLILGANGQLARHTTRFFLEHSDARLTLYLRRANRLNNITWLCLNMLLQGKRHPEAA